MTIEPFNAWVVMFRDPKDPDHEWQQTRWYPSVIITHINGKPLDDDQQFDLGFAQASQEAACMNKVWRSEYEVTVECTHFASYVADRGKKMVYEGVYGDGL
jgi:hypothetical protein